MKSVNESNNLPDKVLRRQVNLLKQAYAILKGNTRNSQFKWSFTSHFKN